METRATSAASASGGSPRTGARLAEAFAQVDADGDGLIGVTEVHEVFRALRVRTTHARVAQLASQHDADADGRVSVRDVARMLRELVRSRQLHTPRGTPRDARTPQTPQAAADASAGNDAHRVAPLQLPQAQPQPQPQPPNSARSDGMAMLVRRLSAEWGLGEPEEAEELFTPRHRRSGVSAEPATRLLLPPGLRYMSDEELSRAFQ
eukprot:TRINITY_DN838_c0_g1_i1.p3 TRINITY_DN838_c0_g1~~TRINITY_DN838_c0_g1_i1.p3  ORF type:complete len:214 (+),score=59.71 TRINITY_DN838_c0_g1_i1:23-643(+)